MRTSLKILLPLLTLGLSASIALAQDNAVAPQSTPDGGPGMGAPMDPGDMQPGPGDPGGFAPGSGGWARGAMRMDAMGKRGYGMRGGMGMRGYGTWGRDDGGRGFMLDRLLRNSDLRQKIGVTDEQAAKIRQESTTFRVAQIRNRADLQIKRLELSNLLAADKPDRAAIDKKLDDISAAQLVGDKARVDFRLTMRDALTLEQKAKLKQLAEQFRNERKGTRRQGGPGGPGGTMRQRGGMRGQQGQKPQAAPPASTAPSSPNGNGDN